MSGALRLGLADHLGWAIAVTATARHDVVDRRRLALIEPGLSEAPIHYDRGRSSDTAMAKLIADARRSIARTTDAAFDALAATVDRSIGSIALRTWPADFPTELATLRRAPYEARADAVMYRQVVAERAVARGWTVCLYEARHVEQRARDKLGDRAVEVLDGPRHRLGAPWAKDHRVALAATIVA